MNKMYIIEYMSNKINNISSINIPDSIYCDELEALLNLHEYPFFSKNYKVYDNKEDVDNIIIDEMNRLAMLLSRKDYD